MKRIKQILAATIIMGGLIGATIVMAQPVLAYPVARLSVPQYFAFSSKVEACKGLNEVDPGQNCGTKGKGFTDLLFNVVKLLSILAGAVAVIMIVVSGLKFITSGGDANKISAAKNSLVYALIGLVVASLAQFLVHYTLMNVLK